MERYVSVLICDIRTYFLTNVSPVYPKLWQPLLFPNFFLLVSFLFLYLMKKKLQVGSTTKKIIPDYIIVLLLSLLSLLLLLLLTIIHVKVFIMAH